MNLTANDKPTKLWRNSLVMLGLFTAHIIINHRLVLHRVAGVGTDPCDAVNLFAGISILFIAIGSLWRISSGRHSSSPLRGFEKPSVDKSELFHRGRTSAKWIRSFATKLGCGNPGIGKSAFPGRVMRAEEKPALWAPTVSQTCAATMQQEEGGTSSSCATMW